MLSFKLLFFDFSLKETLTPLTMLVKTIHCETENDIGKYYHWYSQKNLQKFHQFQRPAVFIFHEWQYWISSGLSYSKKILSTRNEFPINGFLTYLWFKNKCKITRKDSWEVRHVHHVPAVGCVNLQTQSFIFNVLISFHGRFKATKKSSLYMSWNYQN